LTRERSELEPEFDRVELTVIEDSVLHLSFLYEAYGSNEIRVALSDTYMNGQEVKPHNSQRFLDIDNNRVELDLTYRLSKGRHYSLTVYYEGTPIF